MIKLFPKWNNWTQLASGTTTTTHEPFDGKTFYTFKNKYKIVNYIIQESFDKILKTENMYIFILKEHNRSLKMMQNDQHGNILVKLLEKK